jgi:hypothetical protein
MPAAFPEAPGSGAGVPGGRPIGRVANKNRTGSVRRWKTMEKPMEKVVEHGGLTIKRDKTHRKMLV